MPSIKWIVVISAVLIVMLIAFVNYIGIETSNNKKDGDKNLDYKLAQKGSTTYIDTPYVREYSLPHGTWPNAILVGRNGMVWTAGSISHTLISFDPKQEQIKSSYQIKDANAIENDVSKQVSLMSWTMVEDNDGMIWFSQFGPEPLWRFDPNTAKFNVFHSISKAPFQMKVDQETGDIWFTTLLGNTLGVIEKIEDKSGTGPEYKITEFSTGNDTYPSGLFLEKDGVWITEISKNKLEKFTISYNGGLVTNAVKMLEVPSGDKILLSSPTDILDSGNSTIWLTEHGGSFITKYLVDSQNMKRFPTSQIQYHATTLPFWIKGKKDYGGFWLNEHTGNRIAFFNTTENSLTEYEIPTRPSDGYVVYPLNIAIDPNDSNKIWFSEWNVDKIGMIDRSIPIPFNIHTPVDKVVLSKGQQATIDVEIAKNLNQPKKSHNVIFLNASSSMEAAAGFVNMTADFSANVVDLTKINETEQIHFVLRNYSAQPANYTLNISATDGTVTRSIFLDLIVDR